MCTYLWNLKLPEHIWLNVAEALAVCLQETLLNVQGENLSLGTEIRKISLER